MAAVQALKCKECGEIYPLEARFVCDTCFGPLDVDPPQPVGLDGLYVGLRGGVSGMRVGPDTRALAKAWTRDARHRRY